MMFPKPSGGKKGRYKGIPKEVREAVMERCWGACEGPIVYIDDKPEGSHACGGKADGLAHLVHRKMGGSRVLDTEENLVALCGRCHDAYDGRTY